MIDALMLLLPPDVSLDVALLLIVTSLATSMLTAAFGLGGGMGMLAVIATVLPPGVVIPVHGLVQLGNNLIRTAMYCRHINWRMVLWFSLGAVIGGAMGINIVMTMSKPMLQMTLGIFVLYSALAPKHFRRPFGKIGQILSGITTTFATLFVGATGPFVAALLPTRHMARQEILGTHGALMAVQHGLKIALFGAFGFAYGPWLGLLGAMFVVGIAGNFLGRGLHRKLPERYFRRVFQVLLILLALRLIAVALMSWV